MLSTAPGSVRAPDYRGVWSLEGLSFCFVGRCALSSIVAAGYSEAQVAQGILEASVRIEESGGGQPIREETRDGSAGHPGQQAKELCSGSWKPLLPHHSQPQSFESREVYFATNKLNRNSQ